MVQRWPEGKVQPGLTQAELNEAEESLGARFPSELRDYLQIANGMQDFDCDDSMVSFWSVQRNHAERDFPGFWIIADWMIGSLCVALDLSNGEVVGFGGPKPVPVSSTLSEFAAEYLEYEEFFLGCFEP